jgi:hypothetical protein
MQKNRVARIASAAAVASLLLVATAPAADAPTLTGTLTASISPNKAQNPPANGIATPITLKIDNKFKQPAGTTFVLKSLDYEFPKGAVTNGKIFPSCSAAKLQAAHGVLSKCPKGSKIGHGVATGTAVALGITSTGALTLFNGPGGKSITMNINIIRPAAINATFSSPLKKTSGKFGYKLTVNVPTSLQSILDGPIVVQRIQATTGATLTIKGKKRGYIEGKATACPKSGKLPIMAHFFFTDANTNVNATSTTNANIKCRR